MYRPSATRGYNGTNRMATPAVDGQNPSDGKQHALPAQRYDNEISLPFGGFPGVRRLNNQMIQDFLYEIEPHFFKEYPREACGVLAVQKGKAKWFPCTNIAEENDDFIIDSTEYLKIKATSDIIAIVHSLSLIHI